MDRVPDRYAGQRPAWWSHERADGTVTGAVQRVANDVVQRAMGDVMARVESQSRLIADIVTRLDAESRAGSDLQLRFDLLEDRFEQLTEGLRRITGGL